MKNHKVSLFEYGSNFTCFYSNSKKMKSEVLDKNYQKNFLSVIKDPFYRDQKTDF